MIIDQKKSNLVILVLVALLSYLLYHSASAGLATNFSAQLSSHLISSASDQIISFTTWSEWAPNKTLSLYFQSDFDLSSLTLAEIDLEHDTTDLPLAVNPGIGAGSPLGVQFSGQNIIFTQNDTNSLSAGSNLVIKIGKNATFGQEGIEQIFNPSQPGSYLINLGGTFGDTATLAMPILSSDAVSLSGEIVETLNFSLRNSTDTGSFTGCSLGSMSSLSLSTCSYRLAVETNAVHGFSVYIQTDGPMRSPNYNIQSVQENNNIVAGTEAAGLGLLAGNGIIEANDFADDDTPLSTAEKLLIATNFSYNYKEGDLTTSSLVVHKVAVSPATPAGEYSQLVNYKILANF